MALGAIEAKFFAQFVALIEADIDPTRQHDRSYWPIMQMRIADRMRHNSQHEWDQLFRATDCCCTPVLDLQQARTHADMQPLFDGAVPKAPIGFFPSEST